MPEPRSKRTKVRTKLAEARIERGLSQKEMSMMTGIPMATYRRLERGQITSPPIGYLVNCSTILEWPWWELIEEEWVEWHPMRDAPYPPRDPAQWWHGALRKVAGRPL
jgi:transcriptional regulator with XRE-family HTH domain